MGRASAFLNWLVESGRLGANPLKHVDNAETRGRERRLRRALAEPEIELLVTSTPAKRALPYWVAAYTGLRRAELKALDWADVHLELVPSLIQLRAATTKNKRNDRVVLHADVARALQQFRAVQGRNSAVSPGGACRRQRRFART